MKHQHKLMTLLKRLLQINHPIKTTIERVSMHKPFQTAQLPQPHFHDQCRRITRKVCHSLAQTSTTMHRQCGLTTVQYLYPRSNHTNPTTTLSKDQHTYLSLASVLTPTTWATAPALAVPELTTPSHIPKHSRPALSHLLSPPICPPWVAATGRMDGPRTGWPTRTINITTTTSCPLRMKTLTKQLF